jgi:hypothetical protein
MNYFNAWSAVIVRLCLCRHDIAWGHAQTLWVETVVGVAGGTERWKVARNNSAASSDSHAWWAAVFLEKPLSFSALDGRGG